MAQPGSIMWGKFMLMTLGITVAGIGIMKAVTPTDEQLYNRLSPDLKAKVDAARAKRRSSEDMREKLQTAGAGETDQVIWGDSFVANPPPGGRRV